MSLKLSFKDAIAALFCLAAFALLFLVGFDIVNSTKYDLVVVALASYVAGYMIHEFISTEP